MMNNIFENALRETWEMKDAFYEKNKNLSLKEIILKIESKKYDINIGTKKILPEVFTSEILGPSYIAKETGDNTNKASGAAIYPA